MAVEDHERLTLAKSCMKNASNNQREVLSCPVCSVNSPSVPAIRVFSEKCKSLNELSFILE